MHHSISPQEISGESLNGDQMGLLLMKILERIGTIAQVLLEERCIRPVNAFMPPTGPLPQSDGRRD
jgi:hypothetical protein